MVALPVLIHLLNRRFPRLFLFSSVEHLRLTVARQSKLLRFRHWILLILRTCILALLLLAFLKPVLPRFGSEAAGHGIRNVLILVDHSMSMEYLGGSLSPRKRAIAETERILETLGPADLVNIVLVEQSPRTCFFELSYNHAEARRFIDNLSPGLSRADFNQANAAAVRQLAKVDAGSEIYYISDFQRKNWANADFNSLPQKARLFFIDVAAGERANHAVLDATIDQERVLAGETVNLEITVGNFSSSPLKKQVSAVVDTQASFEREIEVPPWSTAKTSIPFIAGGPGLHLCNISLPPDDLPQDNHFHLVIPVLEKEEVLMVSDEEDTIKSGVYYLQTALNPYENLHGSILPRRIRSGGLSTIALAGVNKLFISKSARLSSEICATLAKFVFRGGGIVMFLDGDYDRENLASLEQAIGSGAMPIRLGDKRVSENLGSGSQQIGRGDFKSPFLKLFRGENRQNLGMLEFYDYYRAASTGAGTILLNYADESPAMAELNYGSGALLLMNFSISEFSSNLARQRVFPAWMQEITKNLTGEGTRGPSYTVGDTVTAEVWRNDFRRCELKSPSGAAVALKKEPIGDRYGISFVTDQPGFYTFSGDKLTQAFGVNASPDESDLRQIDKEVLPQGLKPGQKAGFVQNARDLEDLVHGRSVFHYFVIAALVLLLLEVGFQWFLRVKAES